MSGQRIGKRPLSASTRITLDAIRAAAAIYVVAHHTTDLPEPLHWVFAFGQEAVIVFFLLSGFVIFYNEEHRVHRPKGYFLRRIRRLYPPLIIAVMLSLTLGVLGLIDEEARANELVGTLLGLQDIGFLKPGVIVEPFMGNDPLWSLSYELAFYALFPAVAYAFRRDERRTRLFIGALCILAFIAYIWEPSHFTLVLSYFSIWWAGAMIAHAYAYAELTLKSLSTETFTLLILSAIALGAVIAEGWAGFGFYPFLMFRHFAFAAMAVIAAICIKRQWLAQITEPIRPLAKLAPVSYGLYVTHYPLLVQTNPASPGAYASFIIATLAVAWLADVTVQRILPRAPTN